LKRVLFSILVAIPCFIPAIWRILNHAFAEPAGLLSDICAGLVIFVLVRQSPRWLRAGFLLLWSLFQAVSQELLAAVQRLPSWQDVHYLFDPTFVENTTAGFHLAAPVFVIFIGFSTIVASLIPLKPAGRTHLMVGLVSGLLLFVIQGRINTVYDMQSIASRYNPLHWFITDAVSKPFSPHVREPAVAELPKTLRELDLEGKALLTKGKAKNVLIVTLEGISGIYIPEIREKMQVPGGIYQMEGLADNIRDAMLVPDFVTHSHQTIRGLYAIHCGDFSKFSYEMPKAMELQTHPERAAECLPAQMAARGWETHYLQGAGLQFMNKDRAMPAMGFQEVHGVEWFTDRSQTDFIWGTTDEDFFRGARKYINTLQKKDKPWLLSLLTVATHQPFAASDEQARNYGSRKIATVALLDDAVSWFIQGLREDGVLNDTLVIITSDESHGAEGADWYSSWGFVAIFAPEQQLLPRIKEGTYGLVDIEASVLDYLGLPMPPSIIGRSLFRDYNKPREMISYTSSKLRWYTEKGLRYECSRDGNCRVGKSAGILGPPPEVFQQGDRHAAGRLFAMAATLDHKLSSGKRFQVLQFADGEIRQLPEKIRNEWTDNLIGAQYLDFPANSKVRVDIRIQAIRAPESGIQMKLTLRVFEHKVEHIAYPPFPLLHAGEETRIQFAFDNPKALQSFSFHLVGEGKDAAIQLQKFEVRIDRGRG